MLHMFMYISVIMFLFLYSQVSVVDLFVSLLLGHSSRKGVVQLIWASVNRNCLGQFRGFRPRMYIEDLL